MAACLITIAGTSGEVLINYKISSTSYQIVTGIGTVYIEDTATNVTYTTLSGDATASSGCLTVTALPSTCYEVKFGGLTALNHVFSKVTYNSKTITLSGSPVFPEEITELVREINSNSDSDLKVTHYKIDSSYSGDFDAPVEYYIIFKVAGAFAPTLTITNTDLTSELQIVGTTVSCSPSGYTAVTVCDIDIPLT